MSDGLIWHVVGLLLGGVAVTALAVGARAVRRHLLPDWSGAPGLLAALVVAITIVLLVTEVLGSIGLFRLLPMAVALTGAGAGAWGLVRRSERGRGDRPDTAPAPRVALIQRPPWGSRTSQVFAATAVVVVFAEWGMRTWWTLNHGIHTIDSIWYHLPLAARWSQEGWITRLHYLEGEALTTFYPANGAVFHAVGMLFLGNDLISVLVNLAWLAMVLLSAWCIGRPFGVGHLALGVAAVICTTPSLVGTQPGGGYSDIAGVALLLASLAILSTACAGRRTPTIPELALAGLAAGAAFGTKFQFLVPVASLTLAVFVMAPKGERIRRALWWSGALTLTGAFWFVRNWVVVGNPLPAVDLELGPVHFHAAPLSAQFSTVLPHLLDRDAWQDYFVPGFEQGVGVLWWLLFSGLVAFLALALWKRGVPRLLGFVATASLVTFLISPAVLGSNGDLSGFGLNLRYIAPGLAVAGMAACVGAAEAHRFWRGAVMGTFAAYLVGVQVEKSGWQEVLEAQLDEPFSHPSTLTWIAISALILGTVAFVVHRVQGSRRASLIALAAGAVALMVVSLPLRHLYLEERYAEPEGILQPLFADVSWGVDLRGERIAIVATSFQFPLYGDDLSNYVQRVGKTIEYGGFTELETCEEWRTFLNEGAYTYVETSPIAWERHEVPDRTRWTSSDPAATEVYRLGDVVVYRLDGPLDVAGCQDVE